MISWDRLPGDVWYVPLPDNGRFRERITKLELGIMRGIVISRELTTQDDISEPDFTGNPGELAVLTNVDTFDIASLIAYAERDGGMWNNHRRYYSSDEYFDGYQTVYESFCIDVYGWSPAKLDIIERNSR